MKKHLVILHCGQQYLALNPGQRYCNKKCAAYFLTRRNVRKKQKEEEETRDKVAASICVESMHPVWDAAKRYMTSSGYWILNLYLPTKGITISKLEHILIWERWHRKEVTKGWDIHHINEDRTNNDPANLIALPKRLHREMHVQLRHLRLQYCGFEYDIRRRDLTEEFLVRATQLDDFRRQWRLEEN